MSPTGKQRTRRWRNRKSRYCFVVQVELGETDIQALMRRGWLPADAFVDGEMRVSRDVIGAAVLRLVESL